MKSHVKDFAKSMLMVGVGIAFWNTFVKRVPVAGPAVGGVLSGL